MKTLLITIIISMAIATGIKHFNVASSTMAMHKHQIEVAMTQLGR